MAPPKIPQLPRHAEDVDPSEKDAMHLEGVKYFLEHPPSDTQASEVLGNWSENLCDTGLKIISATDRPTGKVVYEYTCHQSHTNRMNNLHGGCTATIFDFCTTTALFPMSKPGFWEYAGVSRTLNVTYLKGVPVGEVCMVECEVVAIGKRLATITGKMYRKSDGALLALCEHGKVNIDSQL